MKDPNLTNTGHSTTVSCFIRSRIRYLLSCFKVIGNDDDPRQMSEHFNSYFQENYNACAAFLPSTLAQALKEAFDGQPIEYVRLALL
jgi:hypothetical protein